LHATLKPFGSAVSPLSPTFSHFNANKPLRLSKQHDTRTISENGYFLMLEEIVYVAREYRFSQDCGFGGGWSGQLNLFACKAGFTLLRTRLLLLPLR
jgi:hypothetical protein